MSASAEDAVGDPHSLFDIKGRTAIVTGASSGLGWTFARGLHAAGANVVAVGRREDRISSLVRDLGEGAEGVVADVATARGRDQVLEAAVQRWSKVSILVNNAGTSVESHPDARDEDIEDFARVIQVNLTGLFGMTQIVARHMSTEGGGSIVNIGSIYGLVGSTGGASYVASKGGVHALTKELAVQWGREGIRVNAIAPGWFPSEMTGHIFDTSGGQRMLERQVPMSRGGRDHELLGALLYLCSDASSYCTGHVLVVDGGYTAQ
jgi:NAD(P)-dependent dehydrogenase (short-subunit alcohol dehydrogenase family)